MPNVVVDAVVHRRALGVGGANTTIPNIVTPSTTSSDAPFFTTFPATALPSATSDNGSDLTKTILEWIFAIAALLVIASLALCRYAQLRRSNRPLNAFIPRPHPFDPRSRGDGPRRTTSGRRVPRTTGLPFDQQPVNSPVPLTIPQSLFYPPFLSALNGSNADRNHRRAVRGADIDAQGRRGGAPDADDRPEGDLSDKDLLPAYESVGGPPKYLELDPGTTGIPLYSLHQHATPTSTEEQAPQDPVHVSLPERARSRSPPATSSPDPTRLTPANVIESQEPDDAIPPPPPAAQAIQRASSETGSTT